MSFGGDSGLFFDPLRGKTNVFFVEDRPANIALARALVTNSERRCVVLDVDALYASQSPEILAGLPRPRLDLVEIMVPSPDSPLEADFAQLLAVDAELLIIDSLNSLNHLLSGGDAGARGRKISFAMASLLRDCRLSGRTAVLTMYMREKTVQREAKNPMAGLADMAYSVSLKDSTLLLKSERGAAWPGGSFSLRLT